ncbi:MAG: NifB/NifX family molybdenum-iron cluster-binding protein [Promethearchaeota archaeon]
MKVAIAATGTDKDSQIHSTFGMAPYFLIFDSISESKTSIQNPMQASGVSTGVEVAQILVDYRIQEVVAGTFRDRVRKVFSNAGVHMRVVKDSTVENVIQSYRGTTLANDNLKQNQLYSLPSITETGLQVAHGACYCSYCSYSTLEESGVPCFQRYCPNCRTPLERKW